MSDTTQGASREDPTVPPVGWTLVMVGPGTMATLAFPLTGEIVIGRDEGAEVRLDHARISRRHARVRLGEICTVEDLGSRNGTRVGGLALAPGAAAQLARGEPFAVGPFTCVLVAERASAAAGPSTFVIDDPAPPTPPELLVTVARSPLTVLIRGETGAGKEVLAETLHRLSGRGGRLVSLNCAAFAGELLESELFGHERGAFTGAVAAKPGLIEVARGGTVFLDEIGEMPPSLQAKLLRAIEARAVLRVGGTEAVPTDVRFLAATNRDLPAEVARGAFRLDLYYRLAVVTLTLTPLRERRDRLARLAAELARAAAERAGVRVPALAPAALARLQQHAWPGNVRELRNVMERAVLLSGGADLTPAHIVIDAAAETATSPSPAAVASAPASDERQRILDALAACAGNQTRAAKMLGISRATLANRLAVLRIPRPQDC